MMNRSLFLLLFALILIPSSHALSADEFVVDRFSKETESSGIPKGWKLLEFKNITKKTRYTAEHSANNFFVKAVSENSAMGIYKEVHLDPKEFPLLIWRWKVENVLKNADATQKSGDDYAARIYVAFEYAPERASFWEKAKYGALRLAYGQYPPQGVLNYVWDNKLPKEKSLDNAYTERAKMIVVESGTEKVGEWVWEERNVYEDYMRLFGSEPPRISFVAIMTDTDNTGESAVAYYDDIVFKAKR
ncbi:MAG: DUF3047 domain-containing protein [Desulfobacterales bacterium]|nr:DUF3047 domain-containing protein [Desulfobacterales bacterium]